MIEEDDQEFATSEIETEEEIPVDAQSDPADFIPKAKIAEDLMAEISEALGETGSRIGEYSGHEGKGVIQSLNEPVEGRGGKHYSYVAAEGVKFASGTPKLVSYTTNPGYGDQSPVFKITTKSQAIQAYMGSYFQIELASDDRSLAKEDLNMLDQLFKVNLQDVVDGIYTKINEELSHTVGAGYLKVPKEELDTWEAESEATMGAADELLTEMLPSDLGAVSDEQRDLLQRFLSEAYGIFKYAKHLWAAYTRALFYGTIEHRQGTTIKRELFEAVKEGGSVFEEGSDEANKLASLLGVDVTHRVAATGRKETKTFLESSTIHAGVLGYVPQETLGTSAPIVPLPLNLTAAKATESGGLFVEGSVKEIISEDMLKLIRFSNTYKDYSALTRLYAKVLLAIKALGSAEEDLTPDQVKEIEAATSDSDKEAADALKKGAEATGATGSVIAGANPNAGKKEATEAQKNAAANIRTSIRDFLTINSPRFAAIREAGREEIYTKYKNDKEYKNLPVEDTFQGVYPIEGKSECGVSQLMYNENQQALLDLTPAEISSLVPMIRIFKQGHNYEQEIPFENNAINNMDTDAAIKLNSSIGAYVENYNKGNSVGIRSLEWSYQGTNPANDTKDISLTLTLYFQSFTDILRNRPTGLVTNGEETEFSYKDLITRSGPMTGGSGDRSVDQSGWDPEYYRIKFLIGYAYSDPKTGAGEIIPDNKRMAIDTCVLPIIATLIDHRFDIQEDGSVNLVITYRGYLEAVAFSSGANIFANSELQGVFNKASTLYQQIMAECGADDTSARLKANLTTQLDWFGKELQTLVFSSLLRSMRKENKIYTIYPRVNDLISRKLITSDRDLQPPSDGDTPEQLISSLVQSVKTSGKCGAKDLDKCVENIFTETVDPQLVLVDGRRAVPFFYVGDLVKMVKKLVNSSYNARAKDRNLGTAAEKAFENTRIILTDIRMTQEPLPGKATYEHEINMADIPVSVETFSIWFVKKITKYQGNKQFPEYSFGLFLSEFLAEVLQKFKSYTSESGATDNLTDASSIQRAQVFAPNDAVGECANTLGRRRGKLTYDLFVPDESDNKKNSKCRSITKITQDDTDGNPMQFYAKEATENWINYFIYYPRVQGLDCSEMSFPTPTQKNLASGYYQFNFGVNSGMVQRISFEKDDQPYVREARFFSSETNYKKNRILQLREPYKLTIDTFGLPNIFPGSVCFIDSRTIDMALGSIAQRDSLAYMLGFGGYHLITHAKNKIAPGEFNTTLTAKWTSHGAAADLNKALRRTEKSSKSTKSTCGFSARDYGENSSRGGIEKAFQKAGGNINLNPNDPGRLRTNYPGDEISTQFENFLQNKMKDLNE